MKEILNFLKILFDVSNHNDWDIKSIDHWAEFILCPEIRNVFFGTMVIILILIIIGRIIWLIVSDEDPDPEVPFLLAVPIMFTALAGAIYFLLPWILFGLMYVWPISLLIIIVVIGKLLYEHVDFKPTQNQVDPIEEYKQNLRR